MQKWEPKSKRVGLLRMATEQYLERHTPNPYSAQPQWPYQY